MTGFDAQITFCYTRDLAMTSRFYEEILGLERVLEQSGCRIYRVTGQAFLGCCERPERAPAGEANEVILTLVTEDVDGWHRRLVEHGVPVEKAPAANPQYLIYHCFVRDPNGYLVEIQRFEDPRWPS
jgi:catechol 2,3-dioxygenase-like lactoylglutathione lyase family enzyme